MTIKQQGGIFGRNPEFREVTVTDDLRVESGGVFVGSIGADSGDINIGNLSGHSGIRFGLGGILPTNGGATSNGTKDLGSSGLRWKDIYLSGNVILSDGKGIDFSATAGTGTSELFDDYEEGTWTPTMTSAAGTTTVNASSGLYTKIGDQVIVVFRIDYSTDASVGTSAFTIGGLPYTSKSVFSSRAFVSSSNWSSQDYNDGALSSVVSSQNILWTARAVDQSSRTNAVLLFSANYSAA